jgi:polyribonucleotide nucleotidyltransferase
MNKEFKHTFELEGKTIELTTGKIGLLAQGSVMIKSGGTVVHATATIGDHDVELDYLPLSIEYIEKMYARGAISGSRFQKREGFPSEEAIVKARQVDHSIRSLFPKSFKRETNIIITVLAYDEVNDPETLAVFGASMALMLSGAPFLGPSSSAVVCVDNAKNIIINPEVEGREEYLGEFLVSGVDGKILNIEGWGKELPEEVMDQVLDKGLVAIESLNAQQREFAKVCGVTTTLSKEDVNDVPAPIELIEKIKAEKEAELKDVLFIDTDEERKTKRSNIRALKDELIEKFAGEGSEYTESQVLIAMDYISKKLVRKSILEKGIRPLKRGLEEIRPLSADIDILPTVHGSALFTRGMTQSLSIVTLGPASLEQMIDDMEGESVKRFMHHYNMPSYATGEPGRYSYHPGRREIGHGTIGANALKNVIPSENDFPYTIRVVSEIMSSNGSTSMAATCAASMALMAAGVPIKEAVAGIGVGLVTEDDNEDNYKLLLDIEGMEDFYGDMDFKICGTKNGVTAIQYENKLRGVNPKILKEAFRLAKTGRTQVLEVMNKVISEPRSELSKNAPIVKSIQIKKDEIGALIGPGGKVIKDLVERSGEYAKSKADINIDEEGNVLVTAANKSQLDFVAGEISKMFEKAEVGKIYEGKVGKVAEYGVFVDVSSNISGLLHISEIVDDRRLSAEDLEKMFKEGQVVKVKVKSIENGRTSFTMRKM